MKYSELMKELKSSGCHIIRNGGNHDIWYSPITKKKFPLPRHQSKEVAKGTENVIRKAAGLEK